MRGNTFNMRQESVLLKITDAGVTRAEYAKRFSIGTSVAAKDLNELVQLGYLRCQKEEKGVYRYYK